jgi:Domain of unknown function (DUF932)
MNLLHAASSEWATRPADQRFWTLADLKTACVASRAGSAVATVPFGSLHVSAEGRDLLLEGQTGARARFTHYAFGQLAASVGAPAAYLRSLPTQTAAECLNVGIDGAEDRSDRKLLFHKNGSLTLRAALSDKYERVWDSDVAEYLSQLGGWRAPAGRTPPGYDGPSRRASQEDILPGQINIHEGDLIAPSGLYASDHDMFAFLVAPDRTIDDGSGKPLMRGIFVRNSEVGDASLTFTFFLMQAVCGNHIVWGAQGVHEVRVRHVGNAPMRKALREFEGELRRYHDGAAEEERGILAARKMILGASKEEVLTALVRYAKSHSLPLSRQRIAEALDVAEQHRDWYGDPRSLWGAVAGLTHASQGAYQDDRAVVDRAAGKLLEMAF